jgi:hypothetical protein
MSKVAHYLQEHLIGEVMTSTDARRYFSTDASIFQVAPASIRPSAAPLPIMRLAKKPSSTATLEPT